MQTSWLLENSGFTESDAGTLQQDAPRHQLSKATHIMQIPWLFKNSVFAIRDAKTLQEDAFRHQNSSIPKETHRMQLS
jgi:hypothetical protein